MSCCFFFLDIASNTLDNTQLDAVGTDLPKSGRRWGKCRTPTSELTVHIKQIMESYREASEPQGWIKPLVHWLTVSVEGVGRASAVKGIHSSGSNAIEVPDSLGMT